MPLSEAIMKGLVDWFGFFFWYILFHYASVKIGEHYKKLLGEAEEAE